MSLPDQLLLSDLLSRRVRCDRGLEHGAGQQGWMHPPVHRLLGWVSRPSALSSRRCVWRLDQLRGLAEGEVLVQGDPADTTVETLERLPTLMGALLLSGGGEPLGQLADAAFEPRTGRILHYLVSRSDPRLPGGSRWRLVPDRIIDQRAGEVRTAIEGLNDLPLARASVRESLLRRSRRWRDQWDGETSRWRDQWQQASGRFEERLEGWLEQPPWEEPGPSRPRSDPDQEIWPDQEPDWRQSEPEEFRGERLPRRGFPSAGHPPRAEEVWEPWQEEDGQADSGRSADDRDVDPAWGEHRRDADADWQPPRGRGFRRRPGREPALAEDPDDPDDPWV